MLHQLARKSVLVVPARIQARSLHTPFSPFVAVARPNNARSSPESKAPTVVTYEPTQSAEKKDAEATLESADQFEPRVYVVSQPDPSLGAPFGVRLGAYPVSEPFAQ